MKNYHLYKPIYRLSMQDTLLIMGDYIYENIIYQNINTRDYYLKSINRVLPKSKDLNGLFIKFELAKLARIFNTEKEMIKSYGIV